MNYNLISNIFVEYLLTSQKENFTLSIQSYCSYNNTTNKNTEKFSYHFNQSIEFKFSNDLKQMLIEEINFNLDSLGKLSYKLNR